MIYMFCNLVRVLIVKLPTCKIGPISLFGIYLCMYKAH